MKTVFRFTSIALAALSGCYAQAVINTVAGNGTLTFSGDGGSATKAGFGIPPDVAVDGAGNLYIVDRNNNRIRKVDTSGTISTFAGNGTSASSGDGGPATSAALFLPIAIAVDGAGNVYIADPGEGLRKVDTTGIISSVPVTSSFLSKIASPGGMTVDSAGNLYVSDLNGSAIYKLDKAGVLTTVAGGAFGFSGDGGPATKAALYFPSGVAIDSAGNIYFADKGNNRVRKVDTKGIITTFAGTGTAGFSGDGGPATSAKLGLNLTAAYQGVAADSAGNVYIADPANNRIRMVNPAGIISTFAGNGGAFATGSLGNGDGGPPASASVLQPNGVRVDSAGNVFIADTNHNLIRKVTGAAATGGSAPTISANGVVNGASFQPGIVANSWVTIQGAGLASVSDDWSNSIVNGALPTSLHGVSVTMGGKSAYIYYVSPGQLNVLAPDVPAGPVSVTVSTTGGTSAAFMTTAGAYAPAFFGWPGNQVVATRTDFSYAVKAGTFASATTAAAKPGDVIILWATGFGPTSPVAPTGVAVPGDKAYATSSLPGITIDNVPATVYGAALAPGSAGLYQIAIQVPPSLPDGDWPIQALIGGAMSPAGTILSVHH
ncbi:MAG TPA: IPT/TIG domain-containing protein [Bryobacteraceae bacterium]|nr:IPT/TIG domain-containing protein [Bryobacteraceae bacterium]